VERESVGGQHNDDRLARLEATVHQQGRDIAQLRRVLRVVGVALADDLLRDSAEAATAES
jgi:hypothetical protein